MMITDKYKKINFKKFRNIFLYLTFGLIIIAVAFEFVGILFNIPAFIEFFKFLFPVCFATLSLFLACHSIVLSKEASEIATSSDNKMKAIAKSNFLEICSEFTDKRIQLVQHPDILGIEGTVWKCRQYVEWACELEEWVEQKYQDKLAKRFQNLLDKTFDWKKGIPTGGIVKEKNGKKIIEVHIMKISNQDVDNILIMFEYFWGIRKENNQLTGLKKVSNKQKSEMIELLEKYIAKRKKSEKKDIDFIRNVRQEIPRAKEMKRKPFKRITTRKRLIKKNP